MHTPFVFGAAVFLASLWLTPIVLTWARRSNIQDLPLPPKKTHPAPTPLLGGVSIFFSILFGFLLFISFSPIPNDVARFIVSISLGMFFLVVFGILDDRYSLPPHYQILGPLSATFVLIFWGVGQDNITNPLYYIGLSNDPLLHLSVASISFLGLKFTFFTDVFTLVWMLMLIYTTKFLDGLNGLVSGITIIGGIMLFITSIALGQWFVAILSLITAAAFGGFLPYNLRGKVFLGEAGSTLAGFLLGASALIGPAKISLTFLILGIPILDALWVIYERMVKAKKSPFRGDLRHLHFKLVERGYTSRQTVMILWFISFAFGVLGLFMQGLARGVLVIAVIILMIMLLHYATNKNSKSEIRNNFQNPND